MGTRHWPDDANYEVERLENKVTTLEAKLNEMQVDLDKARELLTEAREIVYMYNDEYQEEDAKNTLIEIDAFLAKDK